MKYLLFLNKKLGPLNYAYEYKYHRVIITGIKLEFKNNFSLGGEGGAEKNLAYMRD